VRLKGKPGRRVRKEVIFPPTQGPGKSRHRFIWPGNDTMWGDVFKKKYFL
jgi:hypothetical protein